MANTSKYFVTSSPGANFLDFDLHYGSLSLTGEDVGFFGSSKVDMVFARPGVTVDFGVQRGGREPVAVRKSTSYRPPTVLEAPRAASL